MRQFLDFVVDEHYVCSLDRYVVADAAHRYPDGHGLQRRRMVYAAVSDDFFGLDYYSTFFCDEYCTLQRRFDELFDADAGPRYRELFKQSDELQGESDCA